MGEDGVLFGVVLPRVYGRVPVARVKKIVYCLDSAVTRNATTETMCQEPRAAGRGVLRYAAGADRLAAEVSLASVRERLVQHGRKYQDVS